MCMRWRSTPKERLYGIWGATGWLVKIDKKTGSYVQVGKTGLHPISVDDYGVNSLAFGNDGALYWSVHIKA